MDSLDCFKEILHHQCPFGTEHSTVKKNMGTEASELKSDSEDSTPKCEGT